MRVFKLLDRGLFLALVVAMFGCASNSPSALSPATSFTKQNQQLGAPSGKFSLPPFPHDTDAPRQAATLQTDTLLGSDVLLRSANSIVNGTMLILPAAPKGIEWGIWRYAVGTARPKTAAFDILALSGMSWIGIANFATNQWQVMGPFPQTAGAHEFDNLDQGNYVSPAGNIYMMALAWDGSTLTVNSCSFTEDVVPTTFAISGHITDGGAGNLAGVTVTLTPGGASTTTDASGNYSFTGLNAKSFTVTPSLLDYGFNPASSQVTVGPDATGVNFDGTQLPVTYTNVIQPLMAMYCTGCHSPTGSKPDVPLTSYAECVDQGLQDIYEAVYVDQIMPKSPPNPTPGEREMFNRWRLNNYAQ